jgi:CO/xanthine dehydrogenase FAD-binding subunit
VIAEEAGLISHARVAVGSCAPQALRLPALEQRLIGRRVSEAVALVMPGDALALSPIDDVRASGGYRAEAALALVRDCLAAFINAKERAA